MAENTQKYHKSAEFGLKYWFGLPGFEICRKVENENEILLLSLPFPSKCETSKMEGRYFIISKLHF